MKKKQLLSLLLTAAMSVSIFSACGSDNSNLSTVESKGSVAPAAANTASESNDEPSKYSEFITVDVFDQLANYQGIQSGWFAKVVKDKFNMELNIIAPNVAGGGETLFQTRSAAGNLGDLIIFTTENGKFNDLVMADLLVDMTDLVKDKDIFKNHKVSIDAMNKMTTKEGIWAFPNSVSSESPSEPSEGLEPTFGPYIRWDYYAELGYPQMKTFEDMLGVLEDMQEMAREKEGKDNIYGVSLFKDWDDNMMNNAKQIACMYGYDERGFVLAQADGSDYQSIVDSDSAYIRALKFFFDANQKGLVDPDSTTQNYDILSTKYTNGEVLYCPWPWLAQNQFNTIENKEAGKGFMMAGIDDLKIFSYGNSPEGNMDRAIAVGSKAKDPERMVDFIDWLYSPDGIRLNAQANGAAGIKGLTWDIIDGKATLTDFGLKALPSNEVEVPEEFGGGNWKDGVSALNFKPINLGDIDPEINEPYDYMLWETTIANNSTPLSEDWQKHMNADTTMDYLKSKNMLTVAPGASYSVPEEDSNISTIRGQCKATIIENSWKMIFAQDEDEFNSYLKTMQDTVKGLGYEDVLTVDMKNAKDQNDARLAIVESYEKVKSN